VNRRRPQIIRRKEEDDPLTREGEKEIPKEKRMPKICIILAYEGGMKQ